MLTSYLRLIWGLAAVPLGVYSIIQDLNIPLIIQPQLFGFLSIVAWSQVCTAPGTDLKTAN